MIDYVQCNPNIASVNIFHLIDEANLGVWQSGLFYRGYAPKASAAAVQGELAKLGGRCAGRPLVWKPAGTADAPRTTAAKAKPAKANPAKAKPAKAKPAKKPAKAKPRGKRK
jgi:hypothetical protein